jgi:3-oxoacyl-[acyl-carrier-protein] synthase-1
MAEEDPVIAGVGMMTAVGLTAMETAASVRAGIMRFEESSVYDQRVQPFTLAEVPEQGMPVLDEALAGAGLTSREARMLRLATLPIRECTELLPADARPLALILALPETETTLPLDPARFLEALAHQVPGVFDPASSVATLRGRAGGIAAVGYGCDHIRAGNADFVLVGGADTYRDLYVLGTMHKEQRVKTAQDLDGFIPGEGAAFLLLATRSAAAAAGMPALGTIAAWAFAAETGHLYSDQPYRGDGLASAIQKLTAAAGASLPVREVYSSMNGESHWAKEWGVSLLRNTSAFDEAYGMHHPADCFGDTGAAAGPIMAGLAALGLAGGYRRASVLAYGSSDRGERAALIVTS